MTPPVISVIMPVYNGEKFLREAIDSILNQTFSNFEFIILNDGSTDKSEEIILSYSDERIKYIKNENNLQIVKTLNKGLALAEGAYIARMDADDISYPQRFEKQYQFLEANPDIHVCGCKIRRFWEGKKSRSKTFPEYHEAIKARLVINSPIPHPGAMIRKSFFDTFLYEEEYNKAEDYALWMKSCDTHKFHNLPDELLRYRFHPNQTVSDIQIQVAGKIRQELLRRVFLNEIHQPLLDTFEQIIRNDNISPDEAEVCLWEILEANKSSHYFNQQMLTKELAMLLWAFIKNKKKTKLLYNYFKNSALLKKIKLPMRIRLKFFLRCSKN